VKNVLGPRAGFDFRLVLLLASRWPRVPVLAGFLTSGAVVLVAFPFGIYFLAQGLFFSFKNHRFAEAVAVPPSQMGGVYDVA
jgi:hypothetical protein